eukprot:jgi/Mesvir1/10259/Mv13864-RA.1
MGDLNLALYSLSVGWPKYGHGALGAVQHAVIDSVNPLSLAGGALNAFGLARNPVGDAVSGAGKRVTSFIARHTPVAGLTQKGKSAGCRLARMLTYNFARC